MPTYTSSQRTKWASYAERTTMSDAAKKFGVSLTAIRNAMRMANIKPRRPGKPAHYTPSQIERALAMVSDSRTGAEIERESGVPVKYARKLWRKRKGGARARR